MRNTSINRSNLSDEKLAVLAGLKEISNADKNDNTPEAYKRPEKYEESEKQLDFLLQRFKGGLKDDKSPGIYLLAGFIAGALCVFVLNSVLSSGADMQSDEFGAVSSGQSKFEKKISRREKMPAIASMNRQDSLDETVSEINTKASENHSKEAAAEPVTGTYIVKSGDSMSTIAYRFYGKYDPEKIENIKKVNHLTSANRLSIGQKLIIPL